MERFLRGKLAGGRFRGVKPAHRRVMQGVRGKGNRTTEARFRGALVQAGVRGWKANVGGLNGSPDFFFPGESVAVFVDGCFWHGCPRCGHVPKKNAAFWMAKISRNRDRDRKNAAILRRKGIRVLRFWEHQLADSLKACMEKLRKKLLSERH